jgi:hypothetical protein
LRFIKLVKEFLYLIVFTDILFVNNRDLSFQIGYILVLVDRTGYTNIIYWSSIKYKRVTRSVLALELYSIAYGFNIGTLVKSIINRVLEIELLLVVYTDSKSLYKCLVKLRTTREKRLIIDIIYLYQVYK